MNGIVELIVSARAVTLFDMSDCDTDNDEETEDSEEEADEEASEVDIV
jgi:hypothetical protein